MSNDNLNLLLVEDDEVDVEAMKRSLKKLGRNNSLTVASNGIEALEILRDQEEKIIEDPFLVILDLNMPLMGGIEFLKELRSDPKLKQALVLVLTTSNSAEDKKRAYEYNIAGYCVKSKTGANHQKLMSFLTEYLKCVEWPKVK